MLRLENGRSCLYQWDVDQRLEVDNYAVIEVHFDNAVTSPALVCEVYEEDGHRYANIPNILLQQPWAIRAFGCCGSRVRDVLNCRVIRRERPADYVYTETEVRRYSDLERRISALEEGGTGGAGGGITQEELTAQLEGYAKADETNAALEKISTDTNAALEKISTDTNAAIDQLSEAKVGKNGIGQVTKENTTFWKFVPSVNLFDASDIVVGGYINNVNGEIMPRANNAICYAFVKLNGAGLYQLRTMASVYGGTIAKMVPLFDAGKNYVKSVTGVSTDPTAAGDSEVYPVAVEITQADIDSGCVYLGFSCITARAGALMIVKGDVYPAKYYPYGAIWSIPELDAMVNQQILSTTNQLYGKVAVFDGDSICNGSSAEDGLAGWAGRIGEENEMLWRNYAQGGGTIMETEGKYWIGGNIETILSEYPNLDYLILSGGVNDADVWGNDHIGTFNINDFGGTYDGTTFSGALETLLYKAVTYFKYAKIGFVITHKQGPSGYERRAYFDRAAEICEKWGVPCIDLWKVAHLDRRLVAHYDPSLDIAGNIAAGSLYTDGQHLTARGYDVIAPKIEAWMRTL